MKSIKIFISVILLLIAIIIILYRENFNKSDFLENENNYHVIAHSGGGLDGHTYMNALEAYYYEYEHGTRMFDADVRFTLDNVLVLRHEWSDNLGFKNDKKGMNYKDFINTKMFNEYTPMSFDILINFMSEHEDVIVHLDVKNNLENTYKEIVKICKENNNENLLDRMVVSFYNYEDYFMIKNIYPFKYWAIRKYPNYNLNINEILEFCKENNIQYLNIMEQYFNFEILKKFHENNIKVNLAVIDGNKACKYAKMGVDGIVSNFVTEEDFQKCLEE